MKFTLLGLRGGELPYIIEKLHLREPPAWYLTIPLDKFVEIDKINATITFNIGGDGSILSFIFRTTGLSASATS
jgi:hypothetical protein